MRALRVAIVGSCGMGKSALVLRFMSGEYANIYHTTIEDTYQKQIMVDDAPLVVVILDTSGSDQYPALNDVAYTASNAFVLVFSLTQRETLDDLGRIRADISKFRLTEKLPMAVVGEKLSEGGSRPLVPLVVVDRRPSQPKATSEPTDKSHPWKAPTFAETAACPYIETSARNGDKVTAVFEEIACESRKLAQGLSRSRPRRRQRCLIL